MIPRAPRWTFLASAAAAAAAALVALPTAPCSAAFVSAGDRMPSSSFSSSSSSSASGAPNRWGPAPPKPPSATATASASASRSSRRAAATATLSASSSDDKVTTRDVLSLPSIRSTLIRQEETIIFALIERSQFRRNDVVYEKGGFGDLGTPMGSRPCGEGEEDDCESSFLEYMLAGTEALHCKVRRYTSPEEHPFFPSRLPPGPLDNLPSLDYPTDLLSPEGGASSVNFNPILLRKYIDCVVPDLSDPGDDEQHGSTVLADIAALQALSRRVHYGKFVAESKYRSDPEGYQKLVDAGDADGVMALLTNEAVERQVLRRARLKAATYGREPLLAGLPDADDFAGTSAGGGGGAGAVDPDTAIVAAAAASAVVAAVEAVRNGSKEGGEGRKGKVDPEVIEDIYRNIIIPLTKDIEVAYLFRRCGRDPPPEFAPDRMSVDMPREREEAKAP